MCFYTLNNHKSIVNSSLQMFGAVFCTETCDVLRYDPRCPARMAYEMCDARLSIMADVTHLILHRNLSKNKSVKNVLHSEMFIFHQCYCATVRRTYKSSMFFSWHKIMFYPLRPTSITIKTKGFVCKTNIMNVY